MENNRENQAILEIFFTRRKIMDNYILTHSIQNTFTCPSCAFPTLSEKSAYEICSICRWEDDGQDDSNADEILGGPNGKLSLTESRIRITRELEDF